VAGDAKKTGLIFSKAEVEDILHEGPLRPEHDGAFKIKEAFMDMSSSDEGLDHPEPSRQLVPVKKQATPVSQPADPRFDPASVDNQELVLNFIEFDPHFDFDSLFLLGNGAESGSKLFGDKYKRLRLFKIENCVFTDTDQFTEFVETLKEKISVVGILNEGTLESLTVKHLSLKGKDSDKLEILVLNCFSVPKYNKQMYSKSLRHLDISLTQTESNL
jgi:hypothetical protein